MLDGPSSSDTAESRALAPIQFGTQIAYALFDMLLVVNFAVQ